MSWPLVVNKDDTIRIDGIYFQIDFGEPVPDAYAEFMYQTQRFFTNIDAIHLYSNNCCTSTQLQEYLEHISLSQNAHHNFWEFLPIQCSAKVVYQYLLLVKPRYIEVYVEEINPKVYRYYLGVPSNCQITKDCIAVKLASIQHVGETCMSMKDKIRTYCLTPVPQATDKDDPPF